MTQCGSNLVLTAVTAATTLFLWSAVLVYAQPVPPNCPDAITSLNGATPNTSVLEPFIEIEFKLNFGCDRPPDYIDQGVRLEVRLQSVTMNNKTDWFPIKYYTPIVNVPTEYVSLVVLDSSNTSVTAQDDLYNTSLPLNSTVSSGKMVLNHIREYVCGQLVLRLTEDMRLEVRWLQKYGKTASDNTDASWILDDINIRIWNGTTFFLVLSEDFSASDEVIDESYMLMTYQIQQSLCGLGTDPGRFLYFVGMPTGGNTRRSISIVKDPMVIFMSSKGSSESEPTTSTTMATTGISMTTSESVQNTPTTMPTTGISMTTSESVQTTPTTMPTTDISMTTFESIESTPIPTSVPIPSGGESIFDVSSGKISPKMAVQGLQDKYGTTLPQAISDATTSIQVKYGTNISLLSVAYTQAFYPQNVLSSATLILKSISSETDPEAGGRILEFLDIFVLKAYNSSLGKFSNDVLTLQVTDVSRGDYMSPDERIEVLHEPEGTISLPGELFDMFLSENLTVVRVVAFVFKNLSGVLPGDTDDGKMNVWSSKGCSYNSTLSNSTISVCQCNHLTHFAILLSPGLEIDPVNTFALKTIGYIGIAISVFCMIAVIFTLTFLKALWGMRTFIHVNLCVCLGISQIIFVTAVDKTAIKELCQVIAIVLHYFFLTTFMWMLMESVLLYIMLVIVFIKRQYLYMVCFTVVSYGLPALYVFGMAVPLGLTIKDEQGFTQYGSSNETKACWLRHDKHFNWAFITPVIVIIIINIGFFIMVISIMRKHKQKSTEKSKLKNARHWLKTAASLMVVMGITWIIGILVFDKSLIFVAYIFTIITAFQGMFIFILFVVLSKQVKDHYRSWWRGKKGESEFLNKLFSRSKETQSNSSSGTKKRTLDIKTTNIDKLTATATASPSLQFTKKKITNRNRNVCKFENTSNDYVSVKFTNERCANHHRDVESTYVNHQDVESMTLYVNHQAVGSMDHQDVEINQSNDPEKYSKKTPKERVDNEFSSQDIIVNYLTSKGQDQTGENLDK